MGALIANIGPRRRAVFEALALAVGLTFLAVMLQPAIDYALDQAVVVTPALEIPIIWRAAALPVGITLMLFFGLIRMGLAFAPSMSRSPSRSSRQSAGP